MSDKEIAISVKNVSKSFRLPLEQHSGIKQIILNVFKRGKKRGYEIQNVLNDISFDIKKGEFFGIVGRNGSGKSTLLKLISEIYVPDKGSIKINGSLTPFIELGVGFNPELTGRENIYMNGALLGFSNKQMDEMYDKIVEFAELERFMDQKLKNYSSGMQVRLAFSIAIRANSDILVLDEVLAVGDEAFQRKCFQYFAELKRNRKTVILVTHSMDSVQRFCTKALMIEQGEIIKVGNTAKVAQKYRELLSSSGYDNKKGEGRRNAELREEQPVDIKSKIVKSKGLIKISTTLMSKTIIKDSILSIFIDRDTGEQVYRFSTDEKTGNSLNLTEGQSVKVDLELQDIFPNGIFTLRASLKSRDRTKEYALYSDLDYFEIDRRISGASQWDVHWQPNEKFSIESYDG